MAKVKGFSDFDKNGGIVINQNTEEYHRARLIRGRLNNSKKVIKNLQTDVETLKTLLQELLKKGQ